jgi:hypothetical protein
MRWVMAKPEEALSERYKKLREMEKRKGMNKTAVAIANKNVRIIWAMMTRGESYRAA